MSEFGAHAHGQTNATTATGPRSRSSASSPTSASRSPATWARGLRRDVKEAVGRGLVRSGELDGAIVLVESEEEAKEALVRYRARLRDTGYLWVITRKRGHDSYLNQMSLVPHAKRLGLIDNKTCSIDDERSGIRFVVPRALRKQTAA